MKGSYASLLSSQESQLSRNCGFSVTKDLEQGYNERGLGKMIKTFQEYQKFLCIASLYSPDMIFHSILCVNPLRPI